MSLFTCCFWWFVLGVLLGWLLNWLLSRGLRADRTAPNPVRTDTAHAPPIAPPTPVAPTRAADAPPGVAPPKRVIDVAAARAAGFSLKHADDLTIIEGIGPKIDELFRTHGVTSFAQVARLSVSDMLKILEQGGPHFKLANPGTWAQQALLASENRWSELKRLQDELIGGIEPTHRG
jgi:predicted flap endonuclease-1-like 5' DNA nuclease